MAGNVITEPGECCGAEPCYGHFDNIHILRFFSSTVFGMHRGSDRTCRLMLMKGVKASIFELAAAPSLRLDTPSVSQAETQIDRV